MLRNRVNEFLDVTGMRKKVFAEKSSVNPASFNTWINHSYYELSDDNYKRIERCLIDEQNKLREYLEKV